MNTIEITKKLISMPSFVDNNNNEVKVSEWLFSFLKKNSKLNIKKEFLSKDRFNVLAGNLINPEILVTGHIDTVQPNSSWLTNPLVPTDKNGMIYGLGSSDMKAGIAVMLSLAQQKNLGQKIIFLFYCDEEYDFLGMKQFIKDYERFIKPKLIISLDGSLGKLGNSCRGLIEIIVKVKGLSGHSADPKSGINAILSSFQVINSLNRWLKMFRTKDLGCSTLNIAYIRGGSSKDELDNQLGKEGNIIPDYCEYVLEIRVADPKLNARKVQQFIEDNSKKQGLVVKEVKVRHNLGSWITKKEDLGEIPKTLGVKTFINAKNRGYIDIQMLWEAFGQVPCFSLGASENCAHKENEYVKIKNIEKLEKMYKKLIVK